MTINDLKPGVVFEFEGQPWKVLKTTHVHMGRGSSVVQTKMKNVLTGSVQERAMRPRDEIRETDIDKKQILFLYVHRNEYWFCDIKNRSDRFSFNEDFISDIGKFLKPNNEVTANLFKEKIVSIEVPIKMSFRVVEAQPAVRGDTQGMPTKEVKIETGAYIQAPIFIKEGDVIVINTQNGEYVERA